MGIRRNLSLLTAVTALSIAASQGTFGEGSVGAATMPTSSVTVHSSSILSQLSKTAWGVNTRAQDADLQDTGLGKLLRDAGIRALRYPGGSLADTYHWKTNSITPGAGFTTFPGADFDSFMALAKTAGAQPIITVNYGTNATGDGGGSPQEAAAWVKYANVTKKYGIKDWEIGNENYGDWEVNLHKVNSATQYGHDALNYIKDMKAVDPSIQVGLVLANPGSGGKDPNWNDTVLKIAGGKADFVIIHWYPFYTTSTESQVLHAPEAIPQIIAGIRDQIRQDCGSNASHVQILVTETNSNSGGPTPQMISVENGLFLADDFLSFLEQGVENVDWWDLYNDGSPTTGDFGALQDTSNTPYPTFYAMEMLNLFAKPGNRLIATENSDSAIKVHAVKKGNGNLSVLLINEDAKKARKVTVQVDGYAANPSAASYDYEGSHPDQIQRGRVTVHTNQFTQVLPPDSITVVALQSRP